MRADLTRFGLTEMLRCGQGVRRSSANAPTFEDAAIAVNDYLYDALRDATDDRQLVLSRIYKTHPFSALEPGQRAFAESMLGGVPPSPALQCLCLMATRGGEQDWNDRRLSREHVAIPLQSTEQIERTPMVAGLLRQLGIDTGQLVNPGPQQLASLAGKTCNVFHVEHAVGSPDVPYQDFVERYGVRSVIGFGGALPSNALFASVLFSRVPVDRSAADRFRGIALDVKSMLFRYDTASTFSARPAGG